MDFLDSVKFTNEESYERYAHEKEISNIIDILTEYTNNNFDCDVYDTWLDNDDNFIITVSSGYIDLLTHLKNKFKQYNITSEDSDDGLVNIVIEFESITEEQAAHTDGYRIIKNRIGSNKTIVFDYYVVDGDSKTKVRKNDYYNKYSDFIDMTQVEVIGEQEDGIYLSNGDVIIYSDKFKIGWFVTINESGYTKPIVGATDKESAIRLHLNNI